MKDSKIPNFIIALPYNLPTFCSDALWNTSATTFASSGTIGSLPHGIFINHLNTIYVASRSNNSILMWPSGSSSPTKTFSGNLLRPYGLFVSLSGDIYVDNGYSYGRVDKWTAKSASSMMIMSVNGSCYGLFISMNNTLYCSLTNSHRIIKFLLNEGTNTSMIAAGSSSGLSGSNSSTLNLPYGIFVNINFDLYVADCGNNRIQLFQSGKLNGTTVAGSGASGNIILSCPTGVVLDALDNIFIVDSNNNRIVRSGWSGFRCLVGCSGGGSASNQLLSPQTMAFDNSGNIFVTDRNNSRIQKFTIKANYCRKVF